MLSAPQAADYLLIAMGCCAQMDEPQRKARRGEGNASNAMTASRLKTNRGSTFAALRLAAVSLVLLILALETAVAQIDPEKRELFQFGYNGAFEGHPPLALYAFYYRNIPQFLHDTNLTLRLAVAPTYADSELGFKDLFGQNTDLGVGVAGGGYSDSYYEVRNGKFLPQESFDGYGGQANISLYHLFNPGALIPLNGVLRGVARFVTYDPTDKTASNFEVPENMGIFSVRSGLRWGGREPTLFPALAMELSIWAEDQFRSQSDVYGFGDRKIESQSHLFWAEAFLAYQLPKLKHSFYVNMTGGTSIDADRFSAYRVGGFLPMVAEFPLSLPGYYYQEFSAKDFGLFSGSYAIPLDHRHRWNINVTAATAYMDYLPGLEEPGHWKSGLGAGLFYTTPTWRVMIGYGHGLDAIRSHEGGGHSIGFLLQLDLAPAKQAFFRPDMPGNWGGLQRVLGVFSN